ncbi:MAG: hypothetical protein U0T82_15265 [Bacteroidales bacterium]
MSSPQINSFIATTSGLCGGLGKAYTANIILANLSLLGIIDIVIYAGISALVGYGVKMGIDWILEHFKKPK